MAVFKKHLTPLGKGGAIHKQVGKGATEQTLPAPGAMQSLTQGDPAQRTMNNYAKATPMASPTSNSSPSINGLGDGDWGGNGI
jgi:hypothetical protein